MGDRTQHYSWSILGVGDSLKDDGYKFSSSDRQSMDRIAYLGAEGHHHTGAPAGSFAPTSSPTLTLTSGGTFLAGQRIYYRYTLVDSSGAESMPSPEAYVDTPSPILSPAAPPLAVTSGGTLLVGQYTYGFTAYKDDNTKETLLTASASANVLGGTYRSITISKPNLPSLATGFNLYRIRPGGTKMLYVGSYTGTSDIVDTGSSLSEDCDRTIPTANTTNSGSGVTITLPSALPADTTWKIYRTYAPGIYSNSLLHYVVEETSEGSGVITNLYEDAGEGTTTGTPPETSQTVGSPSQIVLTGGAEVRGRLPVLMSESFHEVTFLFNGTLSPLPGVTVWTCPFQFATIVSARASLAPGSTPNNTGVQTNIFKGSGTNPTYTAIYASGQGPSVPVGQQIGSAVTPTTTSLVAGDSLKVDLLQSGGGSGTDHDLTITILLLIRYGSLPSGGLS